MMNTDVSVIHEKLREKYPIQVCNSRDINPNFRADFPVVCGQSALGKFELFYDDVSFPFYAMREDGEVFAHWHLQTLEEAETVVAEFMEGKLTLVSIGYP
jgi:hypothetical protein